MINIDIQTKKLSLIERLMHIREASILECFENMFIQIKMDERAEESLKAINKGEVTDYDKFKEEAKQWIKSKKSTK